jgi:hypothetical protein
MDKRKSEKEIDDEPTGFFKVLWAAGPDFFSKMGFAAFAGAAANFDWRDGDASSLGIFLAFGGIAAWIFSSNLRGYAEARAGMERLRTQILLVEIRDELIKANGGTPPE